MYNDGRHLFLDRARGVAGVAFSVGQCICGYRRAKSSGTYRTWVFAWPAGAMPDLLSGTLVLSISMDMDMVFSIERYQSLQIDADSVPSKLFRHHAVVLQ